MRRRLRNLLPGHRDNALGGRLEAGYQTQQGSLSATGRPQNGYKLAFPVASSNVWRSLALS